MKLLRTLLLALAVCFSATASALADTTPVWDLRTEFDAEAPASNPSTGEVWYYGELTSGGEFAQLGEFGGFGGGSLVGWHAASPELVGDLPAPFIAKNTSTEHTDHSGGGYIDPGDVVLHPGTGRPAVVGWRSAAAQKVKVEFFLNDSDWDDQDEARYQLLRKPPFGSAETLKEGTVPAGGTTGMLSVSEVPLAAEDMLWFVVASPGDPAGEMQELSATIRGTAGGSTEPADTSKPSVRITTPANGARVNDRTPRVIGCAGKEHGDALSVKLDVLSAGSVIQSKVVPTTTRGIVAERGCKSPSWMVDVATDLPDGAYTLRVRQTDSAGNVGEHSSVVTIDGTPPKIALLQPRNGQRVKTARPTFKGRASTDGVTDVAVLIAKRTSAEPVGQAAGKRSGATWTAALPSYSTIPNGTWFVRARLLDAAGNAGYSPWRRIRVDEDPPKPSNNSTFNVVGDADVGSVLAISSGAWSPRGMVDIDYRWERCRNGNCYGIGRATGWGATYRVTKSDREYRLRAEVTGRNASGKTTRVSRFSKEIPPEPVFPRLAGKRPAITGSPQVGATLDAFSGEWRATKPVRWDYQWQQCQFEWLCNDIPGTNNRNYKVRPADAGHKLQVIVWISNKAGQNYAYSSKTVQVRASVEQQRRAAVRDSYRVAFGRAPSQAEEDYWTRSRSENFDQMVANHRGYIRGNRSVAEAVTRLAHKKVFGAKSPRPDALPLFNEDVAAEQREGLTYEELVEKIARRYVRQAYEKIFFWDPVLRAGPSAEVEHYVHLIKSEFFGDGTYDARRSEQIWNAIALSNEPLHGAAATEYQDGAKGAAKKEQCFGAIGPGCQGAGPSLSGGWETESFVRNDGNTMTYIKIETAVGSILHDAICRVYVGGAWCKQNIGNMLRAEFPFSKWADKATAEWDKATYGTLNGRKWVDKYGPYPSGQAKGFLSGKDVSWSGTYSDDLRPVAKQTRYAEVTPGGVLFGLGQSYMPRSKWTSREMRASTRLFAPRGTMLDHSDKDFCRTRSFQQKSALEQAGNGLAWFTSISPTSQYRAYGHCS